MSRLDERRQRVLAYVRQDPGCTARDVAREVFGGSGDTRTSKRGIAYGDLRALEAAGEITSRYPEPRGDNAALRWYPAQSEDAA